MKVACEGALVLTAGHGGGVSDDWRGELKKSESGTTPRFFDYTVQVHLGLRRPRRQGGRVTGRSLLHGAWTGRAGYRAAGEKYTMVGEADDGGRLYLD